MVITINLYRRKFIEEQMVKGLKKTEIRLITLFPGVDYYDPETKTKIIFNKGAVTIYSQDPAVNGKLREWAQKDAGKYGVVKIEDDKPHKRLWNKTFGKFTKIISDPGDD